MFDDMTRQLSEAGRRGASELRHVPKSRRINRYTEANPNEQFRSSHAYNTQGQLGQRQPMDDTPRHVLCSQDPRMFITQGMNPSTITTSTLATDGPHYVYVLTHPPSNYFQRGFTQFNT